MLSQAVAPSKKQKKIARHDQFLEHDIAIIQKMLLITEQLSAKIIIDAPRNLLINLGKLAFEIKHDQDDPDCIRNKFGDYSDEKEKPRENRYRNSGIPFQALFYLSKWLEKEFKLITDDHLKVWVAKQQIEFTILHTKLRGLPRNIDETKLKNIQQLGECANDILHLEMAVEIVDTFELQSLRLDDPLSRYAIARVYAVLGETAKCLSATISNHHDLTPIFQKLGQCRDLVKLPFVLPKTAARITAAEQFIHFHKTALHGFFKEILATIRNQLLSSNILCTIDYQVWLATSISNAIKQISCDEIIEKLQEIKHTFKRAKADERVQLDSQSSLNVVDTESDSEDDEELNDAKMETEKFRAVNLIKGYQNAYNVIIDLQNKLGAINELSTKKVQKKYKRLINKNEKAKQICFNEYGELQKILVEIFPDLPSLDHDALMAFVIHESMLQSKVVDKKPRTPKSQLLVRYTSAVEQIYTQLDVIDPNQSLIHRHAYDQCIAFLGQLYIEIEALHRLVLPEPTLETWDHDFGQTIQLRHQRLMHNVVNYDSDIIANFVQDSVIPWRDNFEAFARIAEFNYLVTNKPDMLEALINRLSGEDKNNKSVIYNTLGFCYMTLQQWTKAEEYFLLAYELCKTMENDHPAIIMHNLSDIYRQKGDWKKATQWMELAWEHRQKYLPKSNSYVVSTRTHLGMCFENLGKKDQALACYNDALDIAKNHHLDQRQVLQCLANFYAESMDFPKAYFYFNQLLDITTEVGYRFYLLQSLEITAIHCGQHEKALEYYEEMSQLFRQNQPYFKGVLGSNYRSIEESMRVGPVHILDLLGRYEEVLNLLDRASNLSYEYQVQKLRLLRNLARYKEALSLAEFLLTEIKEGKLIDEYLIFNCKVFYAQVLFRFERAFEAINILEDLCLQANELKRQKGNSFIPLILSPFNTLCQYFLEKSDYEKAKHAISPTVDFLSEIKLISLSEEFFITLLNLYRAYLSLQNIKFIQTHLEVYESFMLHYLEQPQLDKMYQSIYDLIYLLIENTYINTAKEFLTALTQQKHMSKHAEPVMLMRAYLHLAAKLCKIDKVDEGCRLLYLFLLKHCKEVDKAECSFNLAHLLYENRKTDMLCNIVKNYEGYWDDRLCPEFYYHQIIKKISNFNFQCCNYKGDIKHFDDAVKFASSCIRYVRKIYNLIEEEKPANHESFKVELFKQYWRMPMAIVEFKNSNLGVLYPLFRRVSTTDVPCRIPIHLANELNIHFFGGDLHYNHSLGIVQIKIPPEWRNFISAFTNYLPNILKIGKTPLKPLEMQLNFERSLIVYNPFAFFQQGPHAENIENAAEISTQVEELTPEPSDLEEYKLIQKLT